MLSYLWHKLKSRKLAYRLIVLLTAEIILGAILPQDQFLLTGSARLLSKFPQLFLILRQVGLLPFFSSWLFLGTMLLFFLNTLCCTIEQTAKVFQRQKGRQEGTPLKNVLSAVIPEPQKIFNVLRRHGFRVRIASKNAHKQVGGIIFAQKGLPGSWAVVIFHLSLLLIISGTVITQAMKFEGSFYVAEGQTWSNKAENYLGYQTGPWFKSWMWPDFQLYLEKFSAVYPANGFPQQLTSQVSLLEQGNVVRRQTVQVVKPLRYKGFTVYQIKHGYAPELNLRDPNRQVLLDAVVSMNTNSENEEYSDEIIVPGTGIRINLRFLPDFRQDRPNKFSSRSFMPKNPGMAVTVRDANNQIIFHGPLMVGNEITFQGYNLQFQAYRHWSGFTAVFDPGFPVIFTGFILGTLGLICMFYLDYQRIWVGWEQVEGGWEIEVSGISLKKSNDFNKLLDGLVDELNGVETG